MHLTNLLVKCAVQLSVDQLEVENHQQVADLQIRLGDQENALLVQRNKIKQLEEKLKEKEAYIKELIEAKEKLLSETMTRLENNDIQVMHTHSGTETSIEVDAEISTEVNSKASVRPNAMNRKLS